MNDSVWKEKYIEERKKREILVQQYQTANKWVELFCRGITIRDRLKEWGIKGIVLYGASEFAVRFLQRCEKEKIVISAITDIRINAEGGFYQNIPLVSVRNINKYLGDEDYIVVTAMGYYEEIKTGLEKEGYARIISLRTLLYGRDRG